MPSTQSWGPPDLALFLAELPRNHSLAKTLCTSSVEILERSSQLYEQKVMRLGAGYMEFWLMSAAVGMLPTAPSPATSIAYVTNASDDMNSRCKKTLDRFITLACRILASQQDSANGFASSLRNTIASISPSDAQTPNLNAATSAASGTTPLTTNQGAFASMTDIGMGTGNAGGSGLGGPFDALQDMPMDMGGWSFPDFWAFDLAGDF